MRLSFPHEDTKPLNLTPHSSRRWIDNNINTSNSSTRSQGQLPVPVLSSQGDGYDVMYFTLSSWFPNQRQSQFWCAATLAHALQPPLRPLSLSHSRPTPAVSHSPSLSNHRTTRQKKKEGWFFFLFSDLTSESSLDVFALAPRLSHGHLSRTLQHARLPSSVSGLEPRCARPDSGTTSRRC